jgi:prepilin-type N-terminal cleavage/methylation domain-containing protein
MTPPGRTTRHGQDGFVLIEVIVSALVLSIAAAGVMAVLQATTHSAAAERQHSEAYALAQEDQARLRSLRLTALNRLQQTKPVTLDGNSFTVESKGTFINSGSRQPSNCTSGETSADYVRITSTVRWPGSQTSIRLQSIVSPSNGSLDPNHGTLVITAKKVGGGALSGLGLLGTGAGSFSGATDSTGCANFSDLPAGNYTVTPSGTNLVGTNGLPPQPQPAGVVAGSTSTLNLQYDHGASIPIEFEYPIGGGAFKPAKIDSVYVQNSGGSNAYWTPSKARELQLTANPIYPFPAPDTLWAGSCSSNSPGSTGMATYTFHSGETVATPLHLKVPALELTVKNGSAAVGNATITITDENCNESLGKALTRTYVSESNGHQSSSSTGQPEYGLPYGTYKICASASYSGILHRARESNVAVNSFTSITSKTLSLPSSGSETGSSKTCP